MAVELVERHTEIGQHNSYLESSHHLKNTCADLTVGYDDDLTVEYCNNSVDPTFAAVNYKDAI
jgi:hypothetical protein